MSSEEDKEYKRKIEIYISALEKHRDKSKERKEYAIKQFDTLMIALSTAGLGFVMNYIKDLKNVDLTLAVIAQILFLCCLLTNLFSHVFSMFENDYALQNADEKLDKERYDHIKENEELMLFNLTQFIRDKKIALYGKIVRAMNVGAFLLLISAILTFVFFVFKIT